MYVNPDRYPHFGANNSALSISVHVRDGVVQKKKEGHASCFFLDQYGASIVGGRAEPIQHPKKFMSHLPNPPFFSLFVRFWRDLQAFHCTKGIL